MPLDTLKKLIAGSYGSEDGKFARHNFDRDRARQSLSEAATQQIGLQEFLDLHREFMEGKGLSATHIDNELERVKNIDSYFDYD